MSINSGVQIVVLQWFWLKCRDEMPLLNTSFCIFYNICGFVLAIWQYSVATDVMDIPLLQQWFFTIFEGLNPFL